MYTDTKEACMTGYSTVIKLRRFEEDIDKLGLRMAYPKYGGLSNQGYGEVLALLPKDNDSLPIYSRDAELFVGTLEQAEEWLRGVAWARQYDQLLGLTDDKKRERKEQIERNRLLLRTIKEPGAVN
jgi:hypothetical protein